MARIRLQRDFESARTTSDSVSEIQGHLYLSRYVTGFECGRHARRFFQCVHGARQYAESTGFALVGDGIQVRELERFAELLRDGLATPMRSFPRVRDVRVLWSRYQESDERPIYVSIEHAYDSLADIDAARESPQRRAIQDDIDELMSLFRGRVYHVNFEIDSAED